MVPACLENKPKGLDVFVLIQNIGIGAGIQANTMTELIETGLAGKNYNKNQQKSSQRKSIFNVHFEIFTKRWTNWFNALLF